MTGSGKILWDGAVTRRMRAWMQSGVGDLHSTTYSAARGHKQHRRIPAKAVMARPAADSEYAIALSRLTRAMRRGFDARCLL